MATLVFGSLGTMIGGPIAGAVGSLMGRQLDSMLFGPAGAQGPRLKELAVSTSTYGQPLPRHFGRMRVAGSVIWATDLVEHAETQGSKGGPTLTAYSYSASFAIVLASRPIRGIGRIWADGRLLRGAGGDLKAAGVLRVHTGTGDQMPDPLIAAAEGVDRCPAHRGLAYVVFEDLDLSDFHNRIPTLSFEVMADTDFGLDDVIGAGTQIAADAPLPGVVGYSAEGAPAADIQAFAQMLPLEIHAGGPDLSIITSGRRGQAILLPEPACAATDDQFGGASGFSRQRGAAGDIPPAILRYHDTARDYQTSLQRATGRTSGAAATPGEPAAIDLPAAMDAATARAFIERVARRADWSRERIAWRTGELDLAVSPGAIVALPGIDGHWRVREWEWREGGVELALERVPPTGADAAPLVSADPGRGNPPVDAAAGETRLVAFEMPTERDAPDAPHVFAALSSSAAGWRGAALYADRGEDDGSGALVPLGPGGRARATMGTALSALPPASPLAFDRGSALLVSLVDPGMPLTPADTRQLAQGANLALVGDEIVQFLSATPLGQGKWSLGGFLRGRGGTEGAIAGHAAGEPFVLLDSRRVPLDAAVLGSGPGRRVLALGRGDGAPVPSPVRLDGIALRPLAPVHPRLTIAGDGAWLLGWTRRARGGWSWQDGIDVPLVEQTESYLVTLGPVDAPMATWIADRPGLRIEASAIPALIAAAPGGVLRVRQQGTHALSPPLPLFTLP